MNSFHRCQEIESRGMTMLDPFFKTISRNGQFVHTDKGRLSRELQLTTGDVLMNNKAGDLVAIEAKVEEENKYGNFFLETWSNLSQRRRGWMETLKNTDQLFYLFLDTRELFCIPFPKLNKWAFDPQLDGHKRDGDPLYKRGRLDDFRMFKQAKYEQANDTWGCPVPIRTIFAEVGFKKYVGSASGEFVYSPHEEKAHAPSLHGLFDYVGAFSR
jgi:hypothetical protein